MKGKGVIGEVKGVKGVKTQEALQPYFGTNKQVADNKRLNILNNAFSEKPITAATRI
ncbi:hypothetical protein [Prevotella sp. HUN102]|uniref:hypothetical protein n=1 Tax=Prevotella sp. HUN102 TaxID=1392486 RepID=UPI0012DBEC07|nr:hypothetical protein [Prevotella sp. HUN102]